MATVQPTVSSNVFIHCRICILHVQPLALADAASPLQNARDLGDHIPGESLPLLYRATPTARLASLHVPSPRSPPSIHAPSPTVGAAELHRRLLPPATSSTLVRLLSRAWRHPSVPAQLLPRADLPLPFRDPDDGSLN
jgi:hypothetical protein